MNEYRQIGNTANKCLFFVALFVMALSITGCGDTEGQVGYTPPGLPITISINSRGEISINTSAKYVTFLGTFEIGASIPFGREHETILIIRDFNASPPDKVYEINVGKNITVTTDGQTVITADSRGVVVVDITNGHIQSIEINDGDVVRLGPDGRPLCGGVASRFAEGDPVVVDFNRIEALRVLTDYRGGPNQTIVQAYDDNQLDLLDGPICYKNIWYWRVYFPLRNVYGWVAEGTANQSYLCPLFQKECA